MKLTSLILLVVIVAVAVWLFKSGSGNIGENIKTAANHPGDFVPSVYRTFIAETKKLWTYFFGNLANVSSP